MDDKRLNRRWVDLRLWPGRPLAGGGPLWTALCGLIASGGLKLDASVALTAGFALFLAGPLWGAVWQAVAAALAMRERLAELNQRRDARGEVQIDNGVGISTGEAVAGQIGSLERLMYPVIGDTVNVAARLETLTKDYPEYPILINRPTAEALKGRNDLVLFG